jgi:Uma2 family endonuclease
VAPATANVRLEPMDTSVRPTVRRFTVDEAIRLVELGIVGADEHVELLDGALVEMSPQGARHTNAILALAERLREIYRRPLGAHIREEKPLVTSPHSLPEPDVAVIRGARSDYPDHPTGRDALLVVEVAWSSQVEDRRKATIYAAGAVEVYWLVDLAARKLELRTTPVGGAYLVTRVLAETDFVAVPDSSERWLVRDLLL